MSTIPPPPRLDTEPMGLRLDLDPDEDHEDREVLDIDELLERLRNDHTTTREGRRPADALSKRA